MRRAFWTVVTSLAAVTMVAAQEPARFPDTPQGRLAAGFFAAVSNPDDRVLAQFQEANFSETALARRSPEERLARNRQLRESAGALTLTGVVSQSDRQLVVSASGANVPGVQLVVTFSFTGGASPRIDAIQIQSQ
jgi:hypothetical protein